MKRLLWIATILLWGGLLNAGDTIYLKNGKAFQGKFLHMDAKRVTFDVSDAGDGSVEMSFDQTHIKRVKRANGAIMTFGEPTTKAKQDKETWPKKRPSTTASKDKRSASADLTIPNLEALRKAANPKASSQPVNEKVAVDKAVDEAITKVAPTGNRSELKGSLSPELHRMMPTLQGLVKNQDKMTAEQMFQAILKDMPQLKQMDEKQARALLMPMLQNLKNK
ncbi:MAG: hypothetical protein ACYTGH_14290 [Planctomycetota bacterium]|jgi:hypothetical protein